MINMLLAAMLYASAPADSVIALEGVTVTGQQRRDYQMRTSQSEVQVTRDFLQQNIAGSLMQTLEGIPGVKAMAIGSGQSKPTIRGLGFNRLAVSEDGVKHEGQQWGDDHGLEIDQFSIDRAEVIKGPAALLYGSDAIGGVLSLYTNHVPTERISGSVQLFGRTNNEQLGISAKLEGKLGHWFYRANATLIDYADYKVPTDSIQYYSYWIKLKDNRLRNTAGCERDGSVMLGYAGYNFHTDLRISDSYSKSGFFANAHGLEVRLSDIDYDHSRRDIDLPYQWVNHLKVLSHTTWRTDASSIELNLAYQNNRREELSEPISHGYMPQPDGSLERRFDKNTYTGNLQWRQVVGSHEVRTGISGEYQHNRRSGWGFIIPDFETLSMGAFLMDRYTLGENLILNAGVRYDHAETHIHSYHDWYQTPVGSELVYVERSSDMRRHFNSLTWSAGINYATGLWVMKANIGKSFRMPIPKELGADGINYHIFRYERGNQQLDPEESYQIDASISWANDEWDIQVDPYLNYFPNYIYLNPTSQYVEGLQLYNYTQASVLRYGLEAQLTWKFADQWQAHAQGEYLYARQQSGEKKGYTLPFSTPWSVDLGVKYSLSSTHHSPLTIGLTAHVVGKQDEIVPPEKPTDGFWTLNFAAGKDFKLHHTTLHVVLHADNLLDKRYYDHTSYYRLIDVPEPGRNLSMMVGVEF
ncbi:iron complex outermembrane recepter protein [Prevotellaceae bacterium HUN156]|nr:iron complex outermembrane recepter protein [Prevotellaceae bacterium HUN156]